MTKRDLPPLKALRSFEAVVRHMSFTRAAEELFVTQAAVSQQVRLLSEFVGQKLIQRTGNKLNITSVGKALFDETTKSFDAIGATTSAIRGGSANITSTLKIRVTHCFSVYCLAHHVSQFNEMYPGIELLLFHEGRPLEDSEALRGFDIIIGHGRGKWKGFSASALFTEEIVPLCTPQVAQCRHVRTPSDLANHTLIYEAAHDWWGDWFLASGAGDLKPRSKIVTDGGYFAVEAGLQGKGFILESPCFLQAHLAAGQLIAPFPRRWSVQLHYHLLRPEAPRRNESADAFEDWVLRMNRTHWSSRSLS